MTVDLVLREATVVSSSGLSSASIAIDDGKIVLVGSSSLMPRADCSIDCRGKYIIPGAIDEHVHFGDPWRNDSEEPYYIEDFTSGTRAAAAGGVTTVIDMPDSWPIVTSGTILRSKARVAGSKAVVDFGLHGAFVPGMDFQTAIPEMLRAGASGLKTFTCQAYYNMPNIDEGELFEAFLQFAEHDGVALVHAENEHVMSYNKSRLLKAGRRDPAAYLENRTVLSELLADRTVAFLGRLAGNRFLIVHTTIPEGVEEIREAARQGARANVETCPQYLYLTAEDLIKRGAWAKCGPPLRDKARVARLWELLASGKIDTIGSDHSPQTTEERVKDWGDDIWKAEPGFPGVQTMLPLMLNGVSSRRITLERLAAAMSENPAKFFGLYPKKGAISAGSDADLVVVDMKASHKITSDEQISGVGWTPFDGLRVRGFPVLTVSRGEIVMEEGSVVAKPGRGEFVRPDRSVQALNKKRGPRGRRWT